MFAVVSDPEITRVSLKAIFHPHPSHAANAATPLHRVVVCVVENAETGTNPYS